jgi:hypothetical protein
MYVPIHDSLINILLHIFHNMRYSGMKNGPVDCFNSRRCQPGLQERYIKCSLNFMGQHSDLGFVDFVYYLIIGQYIAIQLDLVHVLNHTDICT